MSIQDKLDYTVDCLNEENHDCQGEDCRACAEIAELKDEN